MYKIILTSLIAIIFSGCGYYSKTIVVTNTSGDLEVLRKTYFTSDNGSFISNEDNATFESSNYD